MCVVLIWSHNASSSVLNLQICIVKVELLRFELRKLFRKSSGSVQNPPGGIRNLALRPGKTCQNRKHLKKCEYLFWSLDMFWMFYSIFLWRKRKNTLDRSRKEVFELFEQVWMCVCVARFARWQRKRVCRALGDAAQRGEQVTGYAEGGWEERSTAEKRAGIWCIRQKDLDRYQTSSSLTVSDSRKHHQRNEPQIKPSSWSDLEMFLWISHKYKTLRCLSQQNMPRVFIFLILISLSLLYKCCTLENVRHDGICCTVLNMKEIFLHWNLGVNA